LGDSLSRSIKTFRDYLDALVKTSPVIENGKCSKVFSQAAFLRSNSFQHNVAAITKYGFDRRQRGWIHFGDHCEVEDIARCELFSTRMEEVSFSPTKLA